MDDSAKLTAQKREIEKLTTSRGWAILTETMRNEMVLAASQIAENRKMDLDEVNFRRGAIWAAQQLLNMPELMLARLEGDILIAASKEALKPTPAKAGEGSE